MALNDRQREVLHDARRSSGSVFGFLLALLVAPLPRAWRVSWEERLGLSPDAVGLPSGFAQLALSFGLGFAGFFWYMQGSMAQNETIEESAMMWLTPIHPFIYMLTTPYGFLAAVGTFGGLVRTLSAAGSRENVPDPTLALIEKLRCLILSKKAATATERAKGERTRDVVEHAQGHEGWDLRILSYDDYGWREGTGVQALGENWKVVAVREVRDAQGRLRIAHELRRPTGAEAIRGYHAYAPASPPQVVGTPRRDEAAAAPQERASIPLSPTGPTDAPRERAPIPLSPPDPDRRR